MTELTHRFEKSAGTDKELLIIDVGVEDSDLLIAGLVRPMEVVFLEAGKEPLGQIAQALSSRFGTQSLHILAHGEPGALSLAGVTVDTAYIQAHAFAMSTIRFALAQAPELALWACSVASGASGKAFTNALAAHSGAGIFAAGGPVGSSVLGGSWDIGTPMPFRRAAVEIYPHVLSGTFSMTGGTVAANVYTQTVNIDGTDVLMTITLSSSSWLNSDSGGVSGTSGETLAASIENPSYTITVTFDTAVRIESLQYFEEDSSLAGLVSVIFDDTSGSGTTETLLASTGSFFDDNGDTVTFSDWTNVTSFTITATTDGEGGNFHPGLDTIVVSLANFAPTLSGAPTDITVIEDTASEVDLSALTFADANADPLTVTFSIDFGTFSMPADGATVGAGVTETLVNNTTITLAGTAADINSYLDTASNIQYTGASNSSGDDVATLTITPNDGSTDGTAASVNVDISAVNDDPTISGLVTDISVTEDTDSDVDLSASAFADVDSAGSVTVTLTAAAGVLRAEDGGSVTVTGSGTGTLTLTGTFTNINTFLDTASNVQYVGVANSNGNDSTTLTITADDGDGSGSVSLDTVNIDITADNDAPTLSGLAANLAATEDVTILIDSAVTFADIEGNFDGGTVTVSGLVTGDVVSVQNTGSGAGEIGFVGGTGAVSYEGTQIGTLTGGAGATATVTLNASATATAVDALLQALTFTATAGDPAASRTLTIGVTDADAATLDPTTSYTLVAGSGNPLDIGEFRRVGFEVSGDFVDIDNDGDLDAFFGESNGNINFYRNDGTATTPNFTEITNSDNPFDGVDIGNDSKPRFVDIDGDGDLDVFVGDGDGDINFFRNDGDATAANFTEVTGASNPFDGVDVGSLSAPTFIDIDNDGDFDAFVAEFDGNINFFRNDGNANVASFTEVTGVTNPFDGVDVGSFAAIDFADIDGDGDFDAILGENFGTFIYYRNDGNAGMASFTEITGADNPFNTIDVGDYSTPALTDIDNDGVLDVFPGEFNGEINFLRGPVGDTVEVVIAVTGVNDDPTVSDLASDVTVTEDTASDLDLSAVTFTDVDSAGVVTVNLVAGAGTMAATSGGSVTVDGSGTGSLTLTGTVANINIYLDTASNIQYIGATDANGNDATTVSVTINDGEGSGNVAAGTVNLDITAVNDAPTASDNTVTMNEDTSRVLTAADFNFVDVDSGNSLQSVRIDTLTVGSGTLRLLGTDVSAGDVITEADIMAGNLVYTPAANANGNGLLTFIFSVNDGSVFAVSTSTFAVDVTDVAEAPVAPVVTPVDNANPSGGTTNGTGLNDSLGGSGGDDTLSGGNGGDTLIGAAGDDFVAGGNGNDIAFAGPGDAGNDTVQGNAGNDVIGGGAGDDIIVGGTFSTSVSQTNAGNSGSDTLFGGSGNDLIVGGSYNSATNTVVNGGGGTNTIWAGTGSDTVFGDDNQDMLGGGTGGDLLGGGSGDDTIYGGTGDDTISSGSDNDQVFSGGGSDNLDGGDGDDTLFGGGGDDTVVGGAGVDEIWAGAGNDDLSGGVGADTFVFGRTSGNDTVTDFDADEDILDLQFASADFMSLADVIAAATAVSQNGQAGVHIDLGDSDSVFVVGISITDLTASNVSF